MVLYEDDAKGNLYLRYKETPSANEVIRDVLEAPIESGETFQNKRKNMISITDVRVLVDAALGKKAEEQVVSEVTSKTTWKAIKKESTKLFGFELPEDAESEQKQLMEM
jgi:hypothetical protein